MEISQWIWHSAGNVTWADEDIQIKISYFNIIYNYVASTALSGIIFAFMVFPHVILLILCHSVWFTGSSCVQQVLNVFR